MSIEAMKLALEALELANGMLERADCSTGYCCCGSLVDGHTIGDGHSPVDEGEYFQSKANRKSQESIKALEEALKQEQGEPVAWVDERAIAWLADHPRGNIMTRLELQKSFERPMPLYTTPQPKQEQGEPVAEIKGFDGRGAVLRWFIKSTDFPAGTTFYTTPQQRTWVGLTDEEVTDFHIRLTMPKLQIKAIEAKLKEKNT